VQSGTLKDVKALAWATLASVAVAAVFAGTAAAKLAPAEQTWVTPLIKVWNLQNAGLHLVLQQAGAKNALVAGEKPQNLALTETLGALVQCKTPTDLIEKAGAPPTKRLTTFRNALNAACIHDGNGASDFAKAIGAVTKNDTSRAKQFLTQGVAEFRKGSAQLTKAYKAIVALGGKAAFSA
jgi:hypothetical protein